MPRSHNSYFWACKILQHVEFYEPRSTQHIYACLNKYQQYTHAPTMSQLGNVLAKSPLFDKTAQQGNTSYWFPRILSAQGRGIGSLGLPNRKT